MNRRLPKPNVGHCIPIAVPIRFVPCICVGNAVSARGGRAAHSDPPPQTHTVLGHLMTGYYTGEGGRDSTISRPKHDRERSARWRLHGGPESRSGTLHRVAAASNHNLAVGPRACIPSGSPRLRAPPSVPSCPLPRWSTSCRPVQWVLRDPRCRRDASGCTRLQHPMEIR